MWFFKKPTQYTAISCAVKIDDCVYDKGDIDMLLKQRKWVHIGTASCSNLYPQHISEQRLKNNVNPCKPLLYCIMVFEGV